MTTVSNPTSPNSLEVAKELFVSDANAQTALLWELARDASELNSPIRFSASDLPYDVQYSLCDIMLAEVKQLGHIDKVPRSYDWEDLLPTLRSGEELLWIVRKDKSVKGVKLFLGIKFNCQDLHDPEALQAREERFQILVNGFSKCLFPESVVERIYNCHDVSSDKSKPDVGNLIEQISRTRLDGELSLDKSLNSVYLISGMPSPKDMDVDRVVSERKEEARSFLSLNDAIEPHLYTESAFTVIFSVSAASSEDLRATFEEKFALRNAIRPFLDREVNVSENLTTGNAVSITPRHETTSTTTPTKYAFLRSLWDSIVSGYKKAKESAPSTTLNKLPKLESRSSHTDKSIGRSETIHISRADLKFVDEHLEKEIKHLQQALGAGGYFATSAVYAEKSYIGDSIARSIRATLSGSHSYLAPLKLIKVDAPGFFQLNVNKPIADLLRYMGVRPFVLNRDSACLSLLLPDADLPGCPLKKSVFYARPKPLDNESYVSNIKKETISFGIGAYYDGGVTEAALLPADFEKSFDFGINKEDVFSHAFIVGAPGGGKSKRAGYILNHIPNDTRLIVLETAKREYAEVLNRPQKKLVRYTLGNSSAYPFRINPFYFDFGTSLKQHIAVLSDAIADLLPMEALIGPKLREAVERCYRRCGWDIETGGQLPSFNGMPLKYPDMLMFNSEVVKVCEGLSDYGPEVRSNYTGALKNRASIFLDDLYQDMFAFDGNRSIDELFPPDSDVVIEMEDMPPSEINIPAFVISIVLQRLRSYRFIRRKTYREYDSNRFVIAIEEAHNVLSRKIEQSGGDERQSGKGGHLLNQVLRLLAEGRGLGLGLLIIDQAAHAIAPSVLADTNTKVILRLEDGEEIKTIGTSIGLAEKDWPDLQRLATGECIVKTKVSPVPVKLAPLKQSKEAGVIRIGEIPVDGTSCVRPEGVPDRLLHPSYIQTGKFLEDLFSNGLLSQTDAKLAATAFLHIASPIGFQRDLIRYMWGNWLFRQGNITLLDEHLDYGENPTPHDLTVSYYAQFMRRIMSDNEADAFLTFVLEEKSAKQQQIRILQKGAQKVIRILEQDCAIFGCRDVFRECSQLAGYANTQTKIEKLSKKLATIIDSNPSINYEWQDLCSHLFPAWRNVPPQSSVLSIINKYGIEEEEL